MAEYVVHDRDASLNEYNVALALDTLKLEYFFQYAPLGFTGLRGQYIVDFLVFVPYEQPMEVYGEYWHTGQLGSDDKLRQAFLEKYFKRPVIILWGVETETEELALAAVRDHFGGLL